MSIKKFALKALLTTVAVLLLGTRGVDAEEVSEVTEVKNVNYIINNVDMTAGQPELQAAAMEVVAGGAAQTPEAAAEAAAAPAPAENIAAAENADKAGADKSDKKKNSRIKAVKGSVDKRKYTKAELRLMSAIIYCEAGVEPYAGKLAVGIVIMNRKESKAFSDSVKGVIYQRGQFSPARNGMLKKALARYDDGKFTSSSHKQCIKAAKEALSGVKKVSYNGKTRNFKNCKYFNSYVRGAKFKIKGHMFK